MIKKTDTLKILSIVMGVIAIAFSIIEFVMPGFTTSGEGVAKIFAVGIIPVVLCVIFFLNQNAYVCTIYCVLFVYNRLEFLIETQGQTALKIIVVSIAVFNIFVLYLAAKKAGIINFDDKEDIRKVR